MTTRTRKTRTVAIEFREHGILHIRALDGQSQSTSDALENLEICRRLLDGKKVPVLVDIRESGVLEREARRVYSRQVEFALAQAMVVSSPFSRIAANLFMRVASPSYPTKMFTSTERAEQWLKGFLE